MYSIFGKIFKTTILVFVFIALAGCNFNSGFTANAVAKQPAKLSAWIAYWDLEAGLNDLEKIGKNLEKLSYFCAYFDKDDRIFIPPGLSELKTELEKKKAGYERYLSFVNDKQNANGSVVLKDIEILGRLFATDASMEQHIDEIIDLTLRGGYDGIEIDYERIWKEEKIGQSFLLFTDKLYLKAMKNNLKLRIVLEPGSPFSTAKFTKGPEYVVMFYNLYGLHSGPGPKANKDFIKKTLTKMQALPGEKSVAFSTGGCLWGDNGEKKFITEEEARALETTSGAETQRDKESQCVVFKYKDKGVSYQVWYADAKTQNYWISVAKEQGENNISLWRLGGNLDINKIK